VSLPPNATSEKSTIRFLLEQAGGSEKMAVEMLTTDLVAELRAEVQKWWSCIHADSRDDGGGRCHDWADVEWILDSN
jgi:DNA-binding transcriptional regulator PaaX